eukprot:m.79151 g.79151  ORF g.79151 m.79151 type:complete len:1531 (-) comp12559_c2_seq1:1806-6398(-)
MATIAAQPRDRKRGATNPHLFLTLEDNIITYYNHVDDTGTISANGSGSISLVDLRAVRIQGNEMLLQTATKTWELNVASVDDAQEWAQLVETASERWAEHEAAASRKRAEKRLQAEKQGSESSAAAVVSMGRKASRTSVAKLGAWFQLVQQGIFGNTKLVPLFGVVAIEGTLCCFNTEREAMQGAKPRYCYPISNVKSIEIETALLHVVSPDMTLRIVADDSLGAMTLAKGIQEHSHCVIRLSHDARAQLQRESVVPNHDDCDAETMQQMAELHNFILRSQSTRLAFSATSVVQAGFMHKLGHIGIKQWQKRYFVLHAGGILRYYDGAWAPGSTNQPKRTLVVTVCDAIEYGPDVTGVQWPDSVDPLQCFSIVYPKRTYFMYCTSIAACEEWVEVLQEVSGLALEGYGNEVPSDDGDDEEGVSPGGAVHMRFGDSDPMSLSLDSHDEFDAVSFQPFVALDPSRMMEESHDGAGSDSDGGDGVEDRLQAGYELVGARAGSGGLSRESRGGSRVAMGQTDAYATVATTAGDHHVYMLASDTLETGDYARPADLLQQISAQSTQDGDLAYDNLGGAGVIQAEPAYEEVAMSVQRQRRSAKPPPKPSRTASLSDRASSASIRSIRSDSDTDDDDMEEDQAEAQAEQPHNTFEQVLREVSDDEEEAVDPEDVYSVPSTLLPDDEAALVSGLSAPALPERTYSTNAIPATAGQSRKKRVLPRAPGVPPPSRAQTASSPLTTPTRPVPNGVGAVGSNGTNAHTKPAPVIKVSGEGESVVCVDGTHCSGGNNHSDEVRPSTTQSVEASPVAKMVARRLNAARSGQTESSTDDAEPSATASSASNQLQPQADDPQPSMSISDRMKALKVASQFSKTQRAVKDASDKWLSQVVKPRRQLPQAKQSKARSLRRIPTAQTLDDRDSSALPSISEQSTSTKPVTSSDKPALPAKPKGFLRRKKSKEHMLPQTPAQQAATTTTTPKATATATATPAASSATATAQSQAQAASGSSGAKQSIPPQLSSEPVVKAHVSSAFDRFLAAQDYKTLFAAFQDILGATHTTQLRGHRQFYTLFKQATLPHLNYKQRNLFKVLDQQRALSQTNYNHCKALSVAVIGAGPVGLRTAIGMALLGSQVVVVERRHNFTRFNILHLWDWICSDLIRLGVNGGDILGKSFFHIGTKELQLLLARLALLIGVRIVTGVDAKGMAKPNPSDPNAVKLWTLECEYVDSKMQLCIPCHVVMAAGGANDQVTTRLGFETTVMATSQALGLVAHWENNKTPEERHLEEFSWASQYNQPLFDQLRGLGADLENVVYYQGETHYFVMTPKKQSLLDYGVLKQNMKNQAELVQRGNIDFPKLQEYAQNVASFFDVPSSCRFHERGGVMLFDFSTRKAAKKSCRVLHDDTTGQQVALMLVGDALLEPFWPEGLGINRGFHTALDAIFAVQLFFSSGHTEEPRVMESLRDHLFGLMKGLSAFTKSNVVHSKFRDYDIDPQTRYKQWNPKKFVQATVGSAGSTLALPEDHAHARPFSVSLGVAEHIEV